MIEHGQNPVRCWCGAPESELGTTPKQKPPRLPRAADPVESATPPRPTPLIPPLSTSTLRTYIDATLGFGINVWLWRYSGDAAKQ